MKYATATSSSFVWKSSFVFFPMFWSLHNKSEQPFEILVPAFRLWGCSQPVGHPESGRNCFVTLERNVMVRGCLWEHRSLYWYSLSRKSENYSGYKWNRAIISPWQSFISYSYLLTNVMGEERGLMSLCHHWHSYKCQIELQHTACSMPGLWCSPAKSWFWWKHCGTVQLQELKLCNLVTSSSTNFFLALASLLSFLFFIWEVRLTLISSVLKIGGCTCEVFLSPVIRDPIKMYGLIWILASVCIYQHIYKNEIM